MRGSRLRHATEILAAWAGVLALASDVAAQHRPQGSRFLSLDGWAYEAIAGLRNRGFLANLDPLTQPYRRADLAAGLRDLDPGAMSEPLAHWTRLLRVELQPELDRLAGTDSVLWGLQAVAGVTASSSRRLDPLFPLRNDEPGRLANRTWPYYAPGVWGETDRFAVEMRLFHDLYHEDSGLADPDGRDPGGVVVLNRTDNAYLSVDFSLGSLFVGKTRRNWAPIGAAGLMLSAHATSYPQLGFELSRGRLSTRFLLGELEPFSGHDRYIVANTLTYQVRDFAIQIGEARVYAKSGGPGLRNLAPFELIFFDNDADPELSANLVLDGQIWLRRDGWVWFGEFLLDDIDVIPETDDPEPFTYAFSTGLRITSIAPWMELGIEYRQVSAFAYRTPTPPAGVDTWSYFDRGLGDNFSDYDRLTLSASLYPRVPGLRLSPTLQIQRKGEGDFRDPVPTPEAVHRASPSFILGTAETTLRIGLSGRYQPSRRIFVEWDGGVNLVNDANHVVGRALTEYTGVARLGLTFELPYGRLR